MWVVYINDMKGAVTITTGQSLNANIILCVTFEHRIIAHSTATKIKWPHPLITGVIIIWQSHSDALHKLLFRTIFFHFGLPEKVVSDNGHNFVSAELKSFSDVTE